MLRKDYIVRQFEEFGKVLAAILGYKNASDWEKFEKEIADAAGKYTGLNILEIEMLDEPGFIKNVVGNEELNQEQKTILARLLFEKMLYFIELKEFDKSHQLKHKCLTLYKHLKDNATENEYNLDVHYKIEFLNKMED